MSSSDSSWKQDGVSVKERPRILNNQPSPRLSLPSFPPPQAQQRQHLQRQVQQRRQHHLKAQMQVSKIPQRSARKPKFGLKKREIYSSTHVVDRFPMKFRDYSIETSSISLYPDSRKEFLDVCRTGLGVASDLEQKVRSDMTHLFPAYASAPSVGSEGERYTFQLDGW
jgi:hypothetical protein